MKRIVLFSALALTAFTAHSQETYENARISDQDLNGTARYVGMGGAMDALGADLSTMSSNPAGMGFFRHSAASTSFGFVSQADGKNFANGKKTNMSFDQIGFVYSKKTARRSFVNLGFNYHKSKNFDFILSAANKLDGNSSQNKQTFLKSQDGFFNLSEKGGNYYGDDNSYSQVDHLYSNVLLPIDYEDRKGYVTSYVGASDYMFNRANTGYIGSYEFNISGNIKDRVYLGLTFGIHDVNYSGYSEYAEALVDATNAGIGSVTLQDSRKITGTGFDVKAGIIFRPIEDSPFRIGLSVATPIWYDLTTSNYTSLYNGTQVTDENGNVSYAGRRKSKDINESYDFKLYTPWKFGLSLGTTVSNCLALGAVYEYSDYSSLDSRINDGDGYDWYTDDYYTTSSSDSRMNDHTGNTLKGVSTLKLGAEYKPDRNFALRVGYNYVSPKYKDSGYKDGTIDSPGSYYSSATDYTNWGSTNRFTCGLGYNIDKFSIDLAYQYSAQNGTFHPFNDYIADTPDYEWANNVSTATKVSNKRSQLLLTLGYHF